MTRRTSNPNANAHSSTQMPAVKDPKGKRALSVPEVEELARKSVEKNGAKAKEHDNETVHLPGRAPWKHAKIAYAAAMLDGVSLAELVRQATLRYSYERVGWPVPVDFSEAEPDPELVAAFEARGLGKVEAKALARLRASGDPSAIELFRELGRDQKSLPLGRKR